MFETPMFGVHHQPEGRDFEDMRHAVKLVEANGYDLFTVTDHFMNMADPNGPRNHPLEAWTTIAGLAAVTSKIRLGTLVSCYAYRRPTVLAKMATTVDIISRGRLIFGIGAGWHEAEFQGFMGEFPNPGTRLTGLKETLEICIGMFNNERFSYSGSLYKVVNVLNKPQPVQKPMPVMVGGSGEKRTLRYAAKYADISHFFVKDLDSLSHKLSVLKGHCEKVGRDFDEIVKGTTFRLALGSAKEIDEKIEKRSRETGIPVQRMKIRLAVGAGKSDDVADRLKDFFDNGLELVTLSFYDLDDIKLFAKEVIPQLK
jgi:F420-dependent oxidoreductase-like protein